MRITAAIVILAAMTSSGATLHDDDSCDIAVMPAATLLLPYFEVDFNAPSTLARTTLFTIVNTSKEQRIARVTIWTDWAYPVMNFNVLLTGYDVQAMNMYDIIGRGLIPVTGAGATSCPQAAVSPISEGLLSDLRTALTLGRVSSCSAAIGGQHDSATGYITIDVVSTCDVTMPTAPAYYDELLYDNVLTGDYEWVNPNPLTGNLASGSPLVHIRAIPGGLPYTFYDRYTPAATRSIDRRQPLPSTFIARLIQAGAGSFNTNFRIWREGVVPGNAACTDYNANGGTAMSVKDEVRFDEHENPTITVGFVGPSPQVPNIIVLPATSSTLVSSTLFPPRLASSDDVGGFLYLNLDNGSRTRHSQNWVVTSMSAEGRYETAFDATPLVNGCTP